MATNKIIDGLKQMAEAAKCDHAFAYLGPLQSTSGVVGRCIHCKCRFTAWPGTMHYEEIMAAKKEGQ